MQSSIDITTLLHPSDWLVFAAVLALTFAAIIYGHRSAPEQSSRKKILDMLVMGRRLTLPFFVMTLVSTWYGGILGVTQYAFDSGIHNWITQGAFWYAAYLLFAFFLIKRVRHLDNVTLPQLVARTVGPRAGKTTAVFTLANVVPVMYVLSLGTLLQQVFGGHLFWWSLAGSLAVAGYALIGGLRSVVYSDLIQFGVMCAAVALLLFWSIGTYGGLPFLREKLPDTHWDLTGGLPWQTTLAWGFIAMGTLIDPNFYQRCFAAASDRTARIGILISTVIWCGFDLCTTFGAMYARAVIPEAESATAYLVYGLQVLPPGLRGFLLAGILATILSTLDSYLFLAGSTVAHDLGPASWRDQVRPYRVAIPVTALVAALIAALFSEQMIQVWKVFGSLFTGALLLPVLVALFRPHRMTENVFLGAVGCAVCAMVTHHLLMRTVGDVPSFPAYHTFSTATFGGEALYPALLVSIAVLVPGLWITGRGKREAAARK